MSTTLNKPKVVIEKDPLTLRYSKRKRGPDPDSVQPSSEKKQKTYKMSSNDLEAIKSLMCELKTDIYSKISESQSSIESKLNEATSKTNAEVNELKGSLNELKSKLVNDIDTIKEQLKSHSLRFDNTTDDLNRIKYIADLRMTGLPYSQNENLMDKFMIIATALKYDTTVSVNVPLIERVPMRNKVTNTMIPSHTIILHFATQAHKQMFYSRYIEQIPLKLDVFALPNGKRITIGENLTRTNANVFKYAQSLKKENRVAQVFTQDGLVKIKFTKGQRAHTIRHTTQLDQLIDEHNKHQQQNQTNQQQQQIPVQQANTHATQFTDHSNTTHAAASSDVPIQITTTNQQHHIPMDTAHSSTTT